MIAQAANGVTAKATRVLLSLLLGSVSGCAPAQVAEDEAIASDRLVRLFAGAVVFEMPTGWVTRQHDSASAEVLYVLEAKEPPFRVGAARSTTVAVRFTRHRAEAEFPQLVENVMSTRRLDESVMLLDTVLGPGRRQLQWVAEGSVGQFAVYDSFAFERPYLVSFRFARLLTGALETEREQEITGQVQSMLRSIRVRGMSVFDGNLGSQGIVSAERQPLPNEGWR
jgi:hypothetical protein